MSLPPISEFPVGQVNWIHDESWRAAKLVVNQFETRLDDAERLEAFHAVRDVIAECLRRTLERRDRELRRLAKTNEPEN